MVAHRFRVPTASQSENHNCNARDGSKLLPNSGAARDVAQAFAALLASAPAPDRGVDAPANVRLSVANDLYVYWTPLNGAKAPGLVARALAPHARIALGGDIAPAPQAPAWSLSLQSGQPRFAQLAEAEAVGQIRAMRSGGLSGGIVASGLIPGVWTPLDPIVDYVVDGAGQLFRCVVRGGEILIEIGMAGAYYVYEGALRVWDDIKNGIIFVLDMAGMLLGKLVRGILDYLFDWPAVLRKRDAMKAAAKAGALLVTTKFPDPRIRVAAFKASLDGLQAGLRRYRSAPATRQALGDRVSSSPSIFNLLPSFANDVHWLLDKLENALPSFATALPRPQIPELDGLMPEFIQKLESMAAALAPSLDDLLRVVQPVLDGMVFSRAIFDAIFDLLIDKLDAIIGVIKDLVEIAGRALHALWSNSQKIVDWLDQRVEIPGLRTFYKELFDNDLSLLDFVCALGALGASALGYESVPQAAGGNTSIRPMGGGTQPVDQKMASVFSSVFLGVGVITTGFDAYYTASVPGGSDLATGANVAVALGGAAIALAESGNLAAEIIASALVSAVGASFGLWKKGRSRIVLDVLTLGFLGNAIYATYSAVESRPNSTVYLCLSAVQLAASIAL
jgi:hypothetical protein